MMQIGSDVQSFTPQEIILIADPRILNVPIVENGDPLIDIREIELHQPSQKTKSFVYGPSPEIPNNKDYTKMRTVVYEKLIYAQSLLPNGLRFCLYEAYRSLTLQKQLYEERYRRVKSAHPSWSPEEVFHETTKLVSPIINLDGTQNIPPHSTGAAIDVYLIDEWGNPIEMGIHPKDWMEDEEGILSQTDSLSIPLLARKNRDIMSKALQEAGFVNYPTEYWHWSYGDRYWAYMSGETEAIYDSVD